VTSLLHAIAELEAADRTAEVRAETAGTLAGESASDEAVRLALQLRSTRTGAEGGSLLFIPTAAGMDAARVVEDAVRGLAALQEGPVHVVDLWSRGGGHGADRFPSRAAVQNVISGDFARRLNEARRLNSYVLCAGGTLPDSVETLAIAPSFDGVILVIAPGQTTRAGLLAVKAQLARACATLSGFVLDARTPSRRRRGR
jgi:hypothetical protein